MGDAVLVAAHDLGHLWYRKVVPLYIDNRSFQQSAVKGWSSESVSDGTSDALLID